MNSVLVSVLRHCSSTNQFTPNLYSSLSLSLPSNQTSIVELLLKQISTFRHYHYWWLCECHPYLFLQINQVVVQWLHFQIWVRWLGCVWYGFVLVYGFGLCSWFDIGCLFYATTLVCSLWIWLLWVTMALSFCLMALCSKILRLYQLAMRVVMALSLWTKMSREIK